MNDNEKNLHQTADDVEGHATRGKGLIEDDTTEGHGVRVKFALPEEGDGEGTEGHAARIKGALPEEGDDEGTEGHGVRLKI